MLAAMKTGPPEGAAADAERLLPHFYKDEPPVFATFRTEGTLALPPPAREAVLERVLREHGQRYAVFALIVMQDHVHLVLQALHAERGWPFDTTSILKGLKEGTELAVRKMLAVSGSVWQEDMFTVELRSQEALDDKCAWVRQNPVRSKLVRNPEEYAWLWMSAHV